MDQVLEFARNFWWLVFPLGGSLAGGARAVAAWNERRATRRLERYRIKQETKVALAQAKGMGRIDLPRSATVALENQVRAALER